MAYDRIEVRPIAGALGAEIAGVDLSRPLGNETFAEVHRAFLEHLVIFFRDQTLDPQQHKAFARRFGALQIDPIVKAIPGHPEILEVAKETDERLNFGGAWHSDMTFLERPPLGSVLYALEVPEYGGDTLFASMYLAYESLSAGMRAMLDGLIAIHTGERCYGPKSVSERFTEDRRMQVDSGPEAMAVALKEIEHPVVRTHPETGRRALYVNGSYTQRFKDMTEAESRPMLDFLYGHAVRLEFTCRFRWRRGSMALWDNRAAMHNAVNDYHGQRRIMHRATIDGDRPR
ncbi:MAG: TauD/TfdA dioxygenase family protein [Alphaproteobacteria bacterium]